MILGSNKLELNHIHLADSADFLCNPKNIPDNSIDAVITSPPYFNQREYNGLGIGNETSIIEFIDNLMKIFDSCYRVVKSTGTIVINLGDKYDSGNLQLIPYRFAIAVQDKYGDKIRLVNDLTWVKSNPTPRQDQTKLISATEPFFIFAKSSHYIFNKPEFLSIDNKQVKAGQIGSKFGDKYKAYIDSAEQLNAVEKADAHRELLAAIDDVRSGEITGIRMKIRGIHALAYGGQDGGRNRAIENKGFTIIRLHGEPMKRDVIERDAIEQPVETIKGNLHPAVFPVSLVEDIIRLLVPNGGNVLDPFSGSGTTALAARNTGRNYIGIEIDPVYHEYSIQRLADSACPVIPSPDFLLAMNIFQPYDGTQIQSGAFHSDEKS